jgi:hypothetical protein
MKGASVMHTIVVTGVKRSELLDLHKRYTDEVNQQLKFCFSYLNFYTGLLSALLAGVLTGLLSLKPQGSLALVLLIGPALICILARIGYSTVRVFYRRYIEAWITSRNLEEMLGLRPSPTYAAGVEAPPYKSKYGGGFITEFERPKVRCVLNSARQKSWTAERVLDEIVETGDTLKYARWVFWAFAIASLAAALVIAWTAARGPHSTDGL